jgi:hypothetical protein
MGIRLETSKRNGIDNHQDTELSAFHLNWARQIGKSHPLAQPRTAPSAVYNCHGLVFASSRTRIEASAGIRKILDDDKYEEVPLKDVLPGDVVIYYSDTGDPNHSGVVVQFGNGLVVPVIYSKWGNAGEFVHALRECPPMYGPQVHFFRCRL